MTTLSQQLPLIGAGYAIVHEGTLLYKAYLDDFNRERSG